MTRLVLTGCFLASQLAFAASDPQDREGCQDPPVFTRMKGFHISNAEVKEFDRFEFPVANGKTQVVEGRSVEVNYSANEGLTLPSGVQVTRNYANAAKAIGGATVYEYEDGGTQYITLKVTKSDAEIWALVSGASNGMYTVRLVEKQLMKQDVTANAEVMAKGLADTGRIALYGIYFDTDKAELKPSSEPALLEIAKLLKAEPKLKLYVVGHTDNVGALEHNLKLSQGRAAAVVTALTKKAVAASRLTPFGAGPTSPVASNSSEVGRAKNRRVELVAQ